MGDGESRRPGAGTFNWGMEMSRETEIAVLSACLSDNRAVFEVAARVSADEFTDEGCASLWRHMLALHGERMPLDIATILPRVGAGRDPKAADAFGEAANAGFSAANVTVYADAIRDKATRLRVVKLAADLAAASAETKAADLIALGVQKLTALETRQQGRAQRFSEAFNATERAILELRDRKRRGELVGAPTGIGELDEAIGGVTGPKLIILAARPAVGKTAVLNLASLNMARNGFGGLICSLEMSTDALVIRALASESGCNVTGLARGDSEDLDKGCESMAGIGDIPLWIDCDTYDIAGICAQAAMHKHRHGIQWLAVDHIGLVETPRFNSRNDQMGHVSRTLKQLAKRLGIPVIALSQLSRECEKDGRRPQMSDLRDSGNIEQDADQVVFLHSPYDQRTQPVRAIEFGVLKNRGGRTGWITGHEFEGATQRIRKVGPRDYA